MASTSGGARHESSVNALAARWIASATANLVPRICRDATGSRAPPATPPQNWASPDLTLVTVCKWPSAGAQVGEVDVTLLTFKVLL